MFANELSVRTCHLDGTHGFFNGAGLLLYVDARRHEPHLLEVVPPPGWKVATALAPAPGGRDPLGPPRPKALALARTGTVAFPASDYDELVDSPVEVGTHQLATFEVLGKVHGIALWGRGGDLERLADDARRIVEHFAGLMGGLPYDRYLFLVHLNATAGEGWSTARAAHCS